jgi:hypothetical protein
VGTGDPAISFGRLEVFLCGTLPTHKLGGERTVITNVDRGKLDEEMERRNRMQSRAGERGEMRKTGKGLCRRTESEGLRRKRKKKSKERERIPKIYLLQRFAQRRAPWLGGPVSALLAGSLRA